MVYCIGKDDYVGITKSICDPIYELLDRGGKRIRPVLGIIELIWFLALLIANCFNKNWVWQL